MPSLLLTADRPPQFCRMYCRNEGRSSSPVRSRLATYIMLDWICTVFSCAYCVSHSRTRVPFRKFAASPCENDTNVSLPLIGSQDLLLVVCVPRVHGFRRPRSICPFVTWLRSDSPPASTKSLNSLRRCLVLPTQVLASPSCAFRPEARASKCVDACS